MLEFYQAYATYLDLMDLTEHLMRSLAQALGNGTRITYQGEEYDFGPAFRRLPLEQAIAEANQLDRDKLRDLDYLRAVCRNLKLPVKDSHGAGKLQFEISKRPWNPTSNSPRSSLTIRWRCRRCRAARIVMVFGGSFRVLRGWTRNRQRLLGIE